MFGDYGLLEGDARNIIHMVFTDPHHRRLLVDWEQLARAVLAAFRAESARYVGDPDFERLIALMTRSSPEFRDWWPQRDVVHRLSGMKHVRHPIAGAMAFEHMSLSIDDGSDMKLIVYTPLAEQNSVAKLQNCWMRNAGGAAQRLTMWLQPLNFVIHGRSKERSDAAQTRGSMPRLQSAATVQNQLWLSATIILNRCALWRPSRHGF